jgi:hypothetical protein
VGSRRWEKVKGRKEGCRLDGLDELVKIGVKKGGRREGGREGTRREEGGREGRHVPETTNSNCIKGCCSC